MESIQQQKGTRENPIILDMGKYGEADITFFGTKRDYTSQLFEAFIAKALENEYNEDGTHNYYDTIHVCSDKVLHQFLNDLWYYHSSSKAEDYSGRIGNRFNVKITYDYQNRNNIKLSCSSDESENNSIYAEVMGL
jgi:hypothetical protein